MCVLGMDEWGETEGTEKEIKIVDWEASVNNITCGYQGVKSGAAYIALADTLPLSAYICRRYSC